MDVVTLDDLFEAAAKHGMDSEADHEIGDLQDALQAAWELMSDEQHLEFNKHPLVVAILTAPKTAALAAYNQGES